MSRERNAHEEALLPVRAQLPDPAPSLVDGSLDVPGRRRGDSRERQHLSPNAPPPLAFLHADGSRSWTIGRAADTAAGCTPGRRGAWSSSGGSYRGANKPSALVRESVGPGERALNAKSPTLSQRWFERLRRGLAPPHGDSGETALVVSPARRRHQPSDPQPFHSIPAQPLPRCAVQAKALQASQAGVEAQLREHQGEARPGEGYDQACAAPDRPTDVPRPGSLPP